MKTKQISSLQNTLVKEIVKLQQKARERKKTGLLVAEGQREISLALQANLKLRDMLVCEELYVEDPHYPVALHKYQDNLTGVSPEIYSRIAYRGTTEGILAVFEVFDTALQSLQLSDLPLLLVLEAVEKPGNLGAILRTADAAGVDAVIICDPQTDVFNPNVIRSSLGCVFTVKIATCTTSEYLEWADDKGIINAIASLQVRQSYFDIDMKRPLAIVLGTESDGLSSIWYEKAREKIRIPMAGKIDSLNVSVSAAVLVYEALRQRTVS